MLNEFKARSDGYDDYLRTMLIQILIFASRHVGNGECVPQYYINDAYKTISSIVAYINNNYAEVS